MPRRCPKIATVIRVLQFSNVLSIERPTSGALAKLLQNV